MLPVIGVKFAGLPFNALPQENPILLGTNNAMGRITSSTGTR
jgi:hypothetical protein